MSTWMHEMLAKVDAQDVPGFVSYFTEDGTFRYASWPAVSGHANIGRFTREFYAGIDGISHKVLGTWQAGDDFFTEGEVTYTRRDSKKVTISFLTRAELVAGKMKNYSVYTDPSPLLAQD